MVQISAFLDLVFKEFDVSISIIRITFSNLVVSLYLISKTIHFLALGLALTLVSMIYLALKNRETILNTQIQKSTKILYDIIFFLKIILHCLMGDLFYAILNYQVIQEKNIVRTYIYILAINKEIREYVWGHIGLQISLIFLIKSPALVRTSRGLLYAM